MADGRLRECAEAVAGWARRYHYTGGVLTLEEAVTSMPVRLITYLDGAIFPCSRAEILMCAEENQAPDHVLDVIESLPDRHYPSVKEILSKSAGRA